VVSLPGVPSEAGFLLHYGGLQVQCTHATCIEGVMVPSPLCDVFFVIVFFKCSVDLYTLLLSARTVLDSYCVFFVDFCRIKAERLRYGSMITICCFWLAVLSYVMIVCCNVIGDFLHTTPLIMGLTLAAVGTSFPNLWSSMVVARQGYGNMAICNALGSNVWNINMALGLPWFIFLLMRNGQPYVAMQNNGIVMFIVMLELVCVIWFAMIALNGFKMHAWMAYVFIAIYFVVMGFAISLS
jgi:Ca2+/Na+ antiporter